MTLMTQELGYLFVKPDVNWSMKAIYTALENKGVTLDELERLNGYKKGTMRNVFYRRCENYERIIADVIGVPPAVIWPIRYKNADVA
jgi:Ner family transcriptional regulator